MKRIYGVVHWTTPWSTFGLLLDHFGSNTSESRFDDCSLVFSMEYFCNAFLSLSRQSRLGIKIVLINIRNLTTAVVASGFQRPLFNFHANLIDGSVTESIALAFQQTILRKSRFQVSKQNNQGLEVVWFD